MSSFRDQLGEDWLRYQHHLDGASPSTITSAVGTNQPTPNSQPLPNGFNTAARPSTSPGRQPSPASLEVTDVLPPPLLSSEPRSETFDADADLETESTLQWPGQSLRYTESTLEDSMVDGQRVVSSPGPSPESQKSARGESVKDEEEEEEDLGGREVKKISSIKILCNDKHY